VLAVSFTIPFRVSHILIDYLPFGTTLRADRILAILLTSAQHITISTQMQKNAENGTHDIKVQILCDPVPSLLELVVKTHDVKGVQSVDNRRAHVRRSKNAGTVTPLRDRSQFVFTPCVPHVVVPAMLHHLQTNRQRIRSISES